ncbi:MAG TPA: HAMP domain-containing sensor histidine kinase [Thermoleophilaceae bacterium]|nr:HAMP domain-containing sensor histidine kinase [Thermoleophilaceae bacterium]
MRTRLPVRLKVAVVSAALTFAILCLFAVVIGAVAEQRIRTGFDDELRATAADLQDRLTFAPDEEGNQRLEAEDLGLLAAYGSGGAVVRIINLRGQVRYPRGMSALAEPGEGLTRYDDLRVVARQLVAPTLRPSGSFESLPRPVAEPVGYLQYAKPERSVERTVNKVRVFLAFGVFGGTLLAFAGGLFVARRAMRPIAGLTRAAREVARTRDPNVTLPKPQANDEVSDLAHTLEDMLRELTAARGESEAALERQRDFVADASHELRTPLTSILANLELLEPELDGEAREMASSALRSSQRMRRLVADLLLLARADAGRQAPRRTLDLSAVAREAATEASPLATDQSLSLDLPASVPVEGVADDLHRLVANLIENALVHTAAGTPVTVSTRREGGEAVVEVADRGPGVPLALRGRIFERFARGAGDSTTGGGSGLGLAIVRAVAEAHGGRVELLDAEGGGARFAVTLPLALDADLATEPSVTRDTA